MTFIDRTKNSQNESITFEVDLHHPVEKVWRALTQPELLKEWLLPVIGHRLDVGAEFHLQAPTQPGWDGKVNCQYLRVEEQRQLSWSWRVGDIDTIVTITLSETPHGTLLHLVQSGFKPHQKRNWGGARYGFKLMTEKLETLLDTMS